MSFPYHNELSLVKTEEDKLGNVSCKLINIIVFRLSTLQDSAVAGSDYITINNQLLTFTVAGDVIQFVDITIRDDDFIEGPENFTVALFSPSSLLALGLVSTTTITILDNDGT